MEWRHEASAPAKELAAPGIREVMLILHRIILCSRSDARQGLSALPHQVIDDLYTGRWGSLVAGFS